MSSLSPVCFQGSLDKSKMIKPSAQKWHPNTLPLLYLSGFPPFFLAEGQRPISQPHIVLSVSLQPPMRTGPGFLLCPKGHIEGGRETAGNWRMNIWKGQQKTGFTKKDKKEEWGGTEWRRKARLWQVENWEEGTKGGLLMKKRVKNGFLHLEALLIKTVASVTHH